MKHYKWGYSWSEIKHYYIQKSKETAERTNAFCSFLVELTASALGSGKKDEEEVGLDTGEGMEQMTDEQLANLRAVLGDADFVKMYPDYV